MANPQIRLLARGTSKVEHEDVERTGGDRATLSRFGPKGVEENLRSMCRAQKLQWHKCKLFVAANGKIADKYCLT